MADREGGRAGESEQAVADLPTLTFIRGEYSSLPPEVSSSDNSAAPNLPRRWDRGWEMNQGFGSIERGTSPVIEPT
jgi:hypothetical protein